jgi:hypothetical protein
MNVVGSYLNREAIFIVIFIRLRKKKHAMIFQTQNIISFGETYQTITVDFTFVKLNMMSISFENF